MKVRIKTYTNIRNGQTTFHWPKKMANVQPKELELNIDKKLIKKGIFWGKIKW